MTVTAANILAGFPGIYLAPTGEALTEIDDLTPPAVTITPAGNWVILGGTWEEYELTLEPAFLFDRINETNGPINAHLDQEEGSLKLKIAERDFTHLNIMSSSYSTLATVASGADQVAQDTLTTGSKAVTTQTAILILATSPEAGSRVIHVPFSLVTSPLVMPFSKKNEPMEVVWTFLSNPAGTAGARMTSWTDITGVAAS